MTRRISGWLLVSVVAHAALVVAVLVVLRFVPAPVLFVDLVHDLLTAVETPGAGATAKGAGPAAPGPAHRPHQARAASPAQTPVSKAPTARTRPSPAITPPSAAPPPSEARSSPAATAPAVVPSPAAPAANATAPPTPVPSSVPSTPAPPSASPPAPTGSVASGSAIEVTPVAPSSVEGPAREGAGPGAATSASVGAGGDGQRPGGGAGRTGGSDGGPLVLGLPGGGGDGGGEYAGYLALLRRRIADTLVFPTLARRRGLSGTAQVELEIQPSGTISQVTLVASSSHRVLDEAALDAVYGVGRVPFPAGVTPRQLRVRLPVVFDLR